MTSLSVSAADFGLVARAPFWVEVGPEARSGDLVWVTAEGTGPGLYRELSWVRELKAGGRAGLLVYPRVQRPERVVVGIDPGFSRTGVCVLVGPHGAEGAASSAWRVIDGAVLRTAKDGALARSEGVLADDLRRVRAIASGVEERVWFYTPDVIAVEAYVVFDDAAAEEATRAARDLTSFLAGVEATEQLRAVLDQGLGPEVLQRVRALEHAVKRRSSVRGRGAAAKTLGTYHAVVGAAARVGARLDVRYPQQLKRALLGRAAGTKADIERAVRAHLGDQLDLVLERRGVPPSERTHAYDACGHGLASLKAEGLAAPAALGLGGEG